MKVPKDRSIYSTYDEGNLSSTERTGMDLLVPCTHKEEDARLTLNVLDAASSGHRWNKIRNDDTDVVVLAISLASALPKDELWITYGSGKNVHNILALAIAMSQDPHKASTLPMFIHQLGVIPFRLLEGVERKRLWMSKTWFLNWNQCYKSSRHHHKRSQRNAWRCLRGLLSLYMTIKEPYESKRGVTKAPFKEVLKLRQCPSHWSMT